MEPILILDGGLGTSLERNYGCKFSPATPLWSSDLLVSDPATLQRCQADFGRVPVDILLTATYQVSVEGFRKTRPPSTGPQPPSSQKPSSEAAPPISDGIPRERIPGYVDTALHIGEAATRGHPASSLALSVGPYGACMVPSQEYSGAYDDEHAGFESLCAWHGDRLRVFGEVAGLGARVGYVALETIPRVDEIRAMRRALTQEPALRGVKFWMSCLFPGEEGKLPDGSTVEDAVTAMLCPDTPAGESGVGNEEEIGCWGIGINCTKVYKLEGLIRRYEDVVEALVSRGKVTAWPALVLYPDGTNGEVYNTTTQTWEMPESADADGKAAGERQSWAAQLADVVRATRARGRPWRQIVVGGCCMASAEDIAALRAELL